MKNKYLLLFSVVEKDETCMTKDEIGNEDARVIGDHDNTVRKGVMTRCHKRLMQNRIGSKTNRLTNNNFFNSPGKLE